MCVCVCEGVRVCVCEGVFEREKKRYSYKASA